MSTTQQGGVSVGVNLIMEGTGQAEKSSSSDLSFDEEQRSSQEGEREREGERSSGSWTLTESPIRPETPTTISLDTAEEMRVRTNDINRIGALLNNLSFENDNDRID